MTKTIALALLLVIVISNGFTNASQPIGTQPPQTTPGWETLDAANYSIQYPSAWQLDQSGQMGTSFLLLSPSESKEDKFKENINLLIQPLPAPDFDLDKYTQLSEEQVRTMMPNSQVIESKRMKSGKDAYHKMTFSGDQGPYHLKFEQFYWIIDNKAYILTFTSEQDKFATYAATGEKIMNSFVLKK